MKPQFVNSVLLGALLSGIGWFLFFREDHDPQESLLKEEVSERRQGGPAKQELLVERLELAKSDREKLDVMVELEFLSRERLTAMLDDEFEKTGDGYLDFSREALLIALAEADPLSALGFVLKTWPLPETEDDAWSEERERACEIVAAEWAHQDSHDFVDYLEGLKTAEDQRFPISEYVIPELLLSGEPSAWMRVYHQGGKASERDEKRFLDTLKDPGTYSQILSSWENLPRSARKRHLEGGERLEQKVNPEKNRLAHKLNQRWKQVDPLGFRKSRFARWEAK